MHEICPEKHLVCKKAVGFLAVSLDEKTWWLVVKNSAASNFYEMRRNLNFMARSFYKMPTRFFHVL